MQGVVATRHGGPEVLTLEEGPLPTPQPGQLLVRVAAAGVNFIDTYLRSGTYAAPLPLRLGLEGAGTVEAVGQGVIGFTAGDRVAWCQAPGSYATHTLVPAAGAVHVPQGVSDLQAATCLLQGMTADYLVHGTRVPARGETALVHAAAGGTGLLLTQMLKRAGVAVIATCSTEAKADLARQAGADVVVLYRDEDFVSRTRALLGGRGVDVVYDSVGRDTFEGSLQCLRPRGLLCLFGQSSGTVPPFDLQRLNQHGSLFVTRPSLAHYIADRDELEARAATVFGQVARGTLELRVGAEFPLAEARAAHEALESRSTTGKVLLMIPTEPG